MADLTVHYLTTDLRDDAASDVVDCKGKKNLRFHIEAPAGTVTGDVFVDGSDDPRVLDDDSFSETDFWLTIILPLGCAHGSGFTAPTEAVDHIDWDGVADLKLGLNFDSPFDYHRVRWVNGSGGTGVSFSKVRGNTRS